MAPKSTSKSSKSAKHDGLQVTAQQSRYHTDMLALDAPTTKEILVKDLSITLGDKEILARTELFLKENGKYVLVGRNGVGKSTLLKAIADGHIPGIPWGLRILLLGQTRELTLEEKVGGLTVQDETVLRHVLRSDKVRERLLHEAAVLSAGLESQSDSTAPVKSYRQIRFERIDSRLSEARVIAERRSGARGLKARQELNAVEDEHEKYKADLEEDLTTISPARMSDDTKKAADMLTEVQSTLDSMDAAAAEAKARIVLLGLGFPVEKIDDSMSKLSGGWKTRCDLACALCQTPDIILLDEPTNFLDLPSVIWLQGYLQELENTTTLVVTHDRDFADTIGQELLVMRHKKLEKFRGNLSTYEREKYKKMKWLTNMQDAQDKQKAHMEKSIQGNIQAAKRTGDDKKLKQAVSRKKKLDERMGMEVNAKGHRFKLNRDREGFHNSARGAIEIPEFDPPVKIAFPSIPPDLRFPGSLVSLEKVSYAYTVKGKKGPSILNDIDLTIQAGDRIGVCGLNGSGKTTLVSTIMGSDESGSVVLPTKGNITKHARSKIARFSQQVVEQLEAFGKENPEITSLKHMMDFSNGQLEEKHARGLLSHLGLQGQIASDIPIAALSGGQKVRLAFAKIVWQPPHLLILDEVTTHLDTDTILSLIIALKAYDGALLVVTHDRFFMRAVVEGESAYSRSSIQQDDAAEESSDDSDEEDGKKPGIVYRMFKGQLRLLKDGMNQYEDIATRAAAKLTAKT